MNTTDTGSEGGCMFSGSAKQSPENARPRYYDVRIPVGSSNVNAIALVACRDCGSFVYDPRAHDKHHDPSPGVSAEGCYWCGRDPAAGLASINDHRFCHGDDDPEPTCYQMAQWAPSSNRWTLILPGGSDD